MYLGNKTADQLKDLATRLVRNGNSANPLHRERYAEIAEELQGRTFGSGSIIPPDLTNAQIQHAKQQAEAARQARDRSAALQMASGTEDFDE